MKSIFERFGFLSMACISAVIILIFMGKNDALKGLVSDKNAAEYSRLVAVEVIDDGGTYNVMS